MAGVVRIGPQQALFASALHRGPDYGADAYATCQHFGGRRVGPGTAHPIEKCRCGFWAYIKPTMVLAGLSGAKLEVDLYGTVGEHGTMYRGSRQRVMRVTFSRRCQQCHIRLATVLAGDVGQRIEPYCKHHARKKSWVNSADLAGWLGTDVVFGPRPRDPIPTSVGWWWGYINVLAVVLGLLFGGALTASWFAVLASVSTVAAVGLARPFCRWRAT